MPFLDVLDPIYPLGTEVWKLKLEISTDGFIDLLGNHFYTKRRVDVWLFRHEDKTSTWQVAEEYLVMFFNFDWRILVVYVSPDAFC